MIQAMKDKAQELLRTGAVDQVLAWKEGSLPCYPEPHFFTTVESVAQLTYSQFCTANLSRYLIDNKGRKTLVFLRPCDAYSYNQLLKENQVARADAYIIGIGCPGCVAVEDGEDKGLLEGCLHCTKTTFPPICDEVLEGDLMPRTTTDPDSRFQAVTALEALDDAERYAFWQGHFAQCIRCNACRNVCPSCHCKKCVFDGDKYDTHQKANVSQAEAQMFHVTRAFHVAGRCTDCGQCSRVCPQGIPLHLLNRKFILDINHMYGQYQAGEDIDAPSPLTSFHMGNDPEPR